ncbi:MAG: hypothetical protein ILA19_01850 [Bacilli bacterium]|nr:hypothetical protein [Bacilli bacterium]
MKKVFKKITIFAVLLCTIIVVTGCSKKVITAENFKNTMDSKGYNVVDVTDQFASQGTMKKGYVALQKESKYQVEFFELETEVAAESMFETNKKRFEEMKGSSSAETSVDGSNYSKYTLSTGGKFKVVTRVENTLLYLDVDKEYKDEVGTIIDNLGY